MPAKPDPLQTALDALTKCRSFKTAPRAAAAAIAAAISTKPAAASRLTWSIRSWLAIMALDGHPRARAETLRLLATPSTRTANRPAQPPAARKRAVALAGKARAPKGNPAPAGRGGGTTPRPAGAGKGKARLAGSGKPGG